MDPEKSQQEEPSPANPTTKEADSSTDIEEPTINTRPNAPSPERTTGENGAPPSALRQNALMAFVILTQLVQNIPLGAGINSGLAIGKALGASQMESVWVVASYPLTQGSFVLIGKCSICPMSKCAILQTPAG